MGDGQTSVAEQRRQELGRYLRSRRAELLPEQVGLFRQPRRRVSGLRRYEVADLASVSDTWYTWLEQGRNINVSADALDSIARALRLDEQARRHIRRLAGIPDIDPEPVPPTVADYGTILAKMLPFPASMTTVAFDLVQWNAAYQILTGDPADVPPEHRNALWSLFKGPAARSRLPDWEAEAQGLVARFRYESGQFPDEPRFGQLVDELSADSEEFRDMWTRGHVRPLADSTVAIDHPEAGRLRFVKLQMRSMDQSRLVLTVHQAADAETEERLTALLGQPG